MDEAASVADLGEFGLIERIAAALPPAPEGEVWTGDDAAVLGKPPGEIVVSTDVLVEDIDFAEWASGVDVGWKAVAANASDLAAMGAAPWRAVATLALPPDTTIAFVDELVEGLAEGAAHHQLGLVGGDLSGADQIVLGVTVLGLVDGPAVTRSGAQVGDDIFVTDTLGGARAGLEILEEELESEDHREALVARQLRPEARVDEGRILRRGGATAMIDVSDGLIADLGHLLTASGVGCRVDPDAIPLQEGVPDVSYALFGGEDFELIFTLPAGNGEIAERLGATWIGRVTAEGRLFGDSEFDDLEGMGWDHLRDR